MLSEARKPPWQKLALLGEGSAYPYLLTFRELEFSETELPLSLILGNSIVGVALDAADRGYMHVFPLHGFAGNRASGK
jgi:hypothetical protein